MPPKCSVIGCGGRRGEKPHQITLHRLPVIESKRKAWLDIIGSENIDIRKQVYVCSLHFDDSCFNRTMNVIRLRDDALPSQTLLPPVRPRVTSAYSTQNPVKPPTSNVYINIKLEGGQIVIDPSPAKNPVRDKLGVKHPILAAKDDVSNKVGGRQELDLKMCRACFATNCRLYSMRVNKKLRRAYEILTGVTVETEDNIPPYLCTECSHRVLNCFHFTTRSLRGYAILAKIVKNHGYITLETIKSINREWYHLSSNLGTTHHKPDHYDLEVTHEDKELEMFTEEQADIHDLPLIEITVEENEPENNSDVDDEVKIKNGDDQEAVNDEAVYGDAFVDKDYSSDDSQSLELLEKKSKPPNDPTQPTINRRRRPFLNEYLSETLFTISDLTVEEQLAEIEKRQESSNYKKSMFKCTICYKGFLNGDAFNGHMTRHSNQCGEFKCEICKTHFKLPRALRKHITAHHTQRFSCNQCPYVTTHRNTARLHVRWHKGTKYKCPHCGDEFLKFSTYMGHVRIKHPSDFVCSLCGYCFVSEKGIELHKKLKHRLENTQIPDDGPLCELCNVRFVSQEAYKRHLSVSGKHNADKQLKEPEVINLRKTRTVARRRCDSNSKVSSALLRSEPIPCEQCGLHLEDSRAYHSHFRRMHPDKNRTNYPSMKSPCMCEVCGRMFQSFALLKDHRWTHTGERPFACEFCGKCFRMRQRLVAHRHIHDQVKSTYSCAVCGKHFSSYGNRQRHMFVHTGLKPFKCEMCGKSFKYMGDKRAHITYVHLKKPWPKRSRGKRRTDRPGQMQPQGVVNTGASEINTAQAMWPPCESKMADMKITGDKSLYYNDPL